MDKPVVLITGALTGIGRAAAVVGFKRFDGASESLPFPALPSSNWTPLISLL
jgi:hypothetical protein